MAAVSARRSNSNSPVVLITKQELDKLKGNAFVPGSELPRCLPLGAPSMPGNVGHRANEAPNMIKGAIPRRTRSASGRKPPEAPSISPDSAPAGTRPARMVRGQNAASSVRKDRISPTEAKAHARFPSCGPVPSRNPEMGLELCGVDVRKLPGNSINAYARNTSVASGERAALVGAAVEPLLQISGLAPTVNAVRAASRAQAEVSAEFIPEDWTSSEEEAEHVESDGDGKSFHYKNYLYHHSLARPKPTPDTTSRRRPRKVCQTREADTECDDGTITAWHTPLARISKIGPLGACHSAKPDYEDEAPDMDQLYHVADVLVRFYGLPKETGQPVRFNHSAVNMVIIDAFAWAHKTRQSQLQDPPVLWVRGGRIYDFHGDRGTLAEFEHDLLVRQVEDDSICRSRRREQGLMPFPFLAAPLKSLNTEDADDADARQGEAREGARKR